MKSERLRNLVIASPETALPTIGRQRRLPHNNSKKEMFMKNRNETQEPSGVNRSRHPLSFALGLAAGIIALAPANAPAQGIPPTVWKPTPFQYDTGVAPSVAVSGVVLVEVHQAGTGLGPLWYHTGKIQENGTVAYGPQRVSSMTMGSIHPSLLVVTRSSRCTRRVPVWDLCSTTRAESMRVAR